MANETSITIVGNLTGDPELAYTKTGDPYARFSIASTPRTFDRQTNDWKDSETLFLRCTAWRDIAEHICESLHKGHRVVATGRLQPSSWETTDGQKRTSIDLVVEEIGPSLRWATARVIRMARSDNPAGSGSAQNGQNVYQDGPSGSSGPSAAVPASRSASQGYSQPAGVPAGTSASGEPPF